MFCLPLLLVSVWLIDWLIETLRTFCTHHLSWNCLACITALRASQYWRQPQNLSLTVARSYYFISTPAVFEWPTTPRPLCLSLSLSLSLCVCDQIPHRNSPWAIPCSQPTRQSWKPLLRYGSGRRNGTSVGGPTTYYFVSSLHIYDSPFSYPHSLRFKIHFQVLKVTCADSQGVYEQEKSRRRDPRLSDIAGAAVSAYLVQQLLFDVLILTQSSLSHHN